MSPSKSKQVLDVQVFVVSAQKQRETKRQEKRARRRKDGDIEKSII